MPIFCPQDHSGLENPTEPPCFENDAPPLPCALCPHIAVSLNLARFPIRQIYFPGIRAEVPATLFGEPSSS